MCGLKNGFSAELSSVYILQVEPFTIFAGSSPTTTHRNRVIVALQTSSHPRSAPPHTFLKTERSRLRFLSFDAETASKPAAALEAENLGGGD